MAPDLLFWCFRFAHLRTTGSQKIVIAKETKRHRPDSAPPPPLHNALTSETTARLPGGCEYAALKNHLAAFWNQHSARTRTRGEMVVKDTTSGNKLLKSQRLRRDEFGTIAEESRLLGVFLAHRFRDIHFSYFSAKNYLSTPVVRLATGIGPGRGTLCRVEQTPEPT